MGLDGKFADEQFVAAELPFVVGLIRRDASPFLGLGHGLFRRCKAPVWHDKAGPESLFDYDAFFFRIDFRERPHVLDVHHDVDFRRDLIELFRFDLQKPRIFGRRRDRRFHNFPGNIHRPSPEPHRS